MDIDRFGQIAIKLCSHQSFLHILSHRPSQRHQPQSRIRSAESFPKRQSIKLPTQVQIQKDHIRIPFLRQSQGLLDVRCLLNLVTRHFKEQLQRAQRIGMIVD